MWCIIYYGDSVCIMSYQTPVIHMVADVLVAGWSLAGPDFLWAGHSSAGRLVEPLAAGAHAEHLPPLGALSARGRALGKHIDTGGLVRVCVC